MKYKRVCSDANCKAIFYCEGECQVKRKIELENNCFCPKCLQETLQKHPDFYPEDSPLRCKSRLGGT